MWKGRPSKICDIPHIALLFTLASVSFALSLFFNSITFGVIGIVVSFCFLLKIWDAPSPAYAISNKELKISKGTIFKKEERIELFRIKDISTSSIFFLNWIKIGKINLLTTDSTSPQVIMKYIKNYKDVANLIRKEVLEARKENNIQEIDME